MSGAMLRRTAVILLAGATACAPRPAPLLVVGALRHDLPGFLRSHPLGPTDGIRADEIARTDGTSYHIVQIRGSEPPHRHAVHDLMVLVLRGRGRLTRSGERFEMRSGDFAVVPRDTPHWFAAEGAEAAVALIAFTPPLDAPDSVPEPLR